jgi:hypothetical protein
MDPTSMPPLRAHARGVRQCRGGSEWFDWLLRASSGRGLGARDKIATGAGGGSGARKGVQVRASPVVRRDLLAP